MTPIMLSSTKKQKKNLNHKMLTLRNCLVFVLALLLPCICRTLSAECSVQQAIVLGSTSHYLECPGVPRTQAFPAVQCIVMSQTNSFSFSASVVVGCSNSASDMFSGVINTEIKCLFGLKQAEILST